MCICVCVRVRLHVYVCVCVTDSLSLLDSVDPTELTTLHSHKVRYIACGDEHTAVLTEVKYITMQVS